MKNSVSSSSCTEPGRPRAPKLWLATTAAGRISETGDVVKLNSFRELITAKPYAGWDTDPAKVEAVIRDDPEVLALWKSAMKSRGNRFLKHDNVMPQEQGNSRAQPG